MKCQFNPINEWKKYLLKGTRDVKFKNEDLSKIGIVITFEI